MSDEKSFLSVIKEAGISFPEVLGLLRKEGKITDLKTQEEIEAAKTKVEKDKKAKKKEKKKEKEKEEPEEPAPPEEPEPEDKEKDLKKRLTDIEAQLEKLSKSGKIPRKTPSEGKEVEGDELPDGVKPKNLTTNKFEVRV